MERENVDASESWLQELLATPLDLNQVSAATLLRLPFLSQAQIAAFLVHRQREVYYADLEQALLALQVTGDTLEFCRTVFTITVPTAVGASTPRHVLLRSRYGAPARLEKNWIGAKRRLYHRLQLAYGAFHAGALTERDPGELRWDDHRVWYGMWQHAQGRIILGNFQTEWGLGLAQWGPYAATPAAEVHAAMRRWGRGIMPFVSSNESTAYEGVAISQAWQRWRILAYLSSVSRDANLHENLWVTSYRTNGYHRTAYENALRDNLHEKTVGGALHYRFGIGCELGVLIQTMAFDRAWQNGNRRESFFDFVGRRNSVFSVAGRWQWPKQCLNFEVAQSRSRGKVAALTFLHQERMASWMIALFHADRDFHSAHGRSLFASEEPAQAESGYAFGLKVRAQRRATVEFFYQREQGLWRTHELPLPPQARLVGASVQWNITNEARLRLRYTFSENEDLVPGNEQTVQVGNAVSRYRCELEHRLSSRLRLKPGLDVARKHAVAFPAPMPNRVGTAISFDVQYSFSSRLVLNARQTHFYAPFGMYSYERDLPGAFTVVALRESGVRRYIYGHLKLHPNFSVAGKVSVGEPDRIAVLERQYFAWAVQLDWTPRWNVPGQ